MPRGKQKKQSEDATDENMPKKRDQSVQNQPISDDGGGKRKGKKASPAQKEAPSASNQVQLANPNEESEVEFESIEKTLEESLSYESLTWMRHVIRVQAAEVVKTILKQEKETNDELQENSHKEMTTQLGELQKKLLKIQEDVDMLQTENARQHRLIERLEHKNYEKQSEINKLKNKLDEIDQEGHSLSMQIVGFAENKDEGDDIKQFTKLLKEKTGVKIKPTDVTEMKRLGKRNDVKSRNVIARFKDKETRQKIYKERKKLIQSGSPNKSVYLNDALTQHRQQLLYAARQLVKGRKLYAAWSQDGNILVRKGEASSIIQVHDHDDLMIIKTKETESDDTSSQATHLSDYSYYVDSDVV